MELKHPAVYLRGGYLADSKGSPCRDYVVACIAFRDLKVTVGDRVPSCPPAFGILSFGVPEVRCKVV